MIFNSVTFLLFLGVVVCLYWSLPKRPRLWMLFIMSLAFYGFWKVEYLTVMLISAVTDYFTAIAIYNTPVENRSRRRALLALTLTVNLGLLVYFKYLYFFTSNTNWVLESLGMHWQFPLLYVILPFGISFYTFETISYTIDVYRGLIKPERSFIVYGLFVTFFPKLVAGPIQRAAELVVQFKNRITFQVGFLSEGLKRIMYGLFLKVVLADNIGPIVDDCFQIQANSLSALDVWTMAFLFGFQIYLDFAAYSHIAIGSALLMGITIPENFNFPYVATSLKDFWKRWHISLSSWIRDYLYLPLSGVKVVTTTGKGGIGESLGNEGKVSQAKKNSALFLTWGIMGLWHGANWTFVVWGLYHAVFIFLERKLKPLRTAIPVLNSPWAGWCFTFPIVMLSWIPFRAQSVSETMILWSKIFVPSGYLRIGFRENTYIVAALIVVLFFAVYFADRYLNPLISKYKVIFSIWNTAKYAVMFILVFTFLRPISQFIYFQF